MFIFHDESNCIWFGVKLPAKECLLSLLYLKLECPMFLRQQRCNRVLTRPSQAPMTQLQLAREGLLCKRRMPGQDRAHRPGSEARAKLRGSGERHCPLPCPSALQRGVGTATKANTRSPRVPACCPPAPGLWGRAGAGAAAGNLYPGRFCLRRANSQGLKVFHLERQSAFFLSISGQTPMVPGTSLLPNGGAAFSFRLRVILLALLCWNRA